MMQQKHGDIDYRKRRWYLAGFTALVAVGINIVRSDSFYELVKPVKNAIRGGYLLDSVMWDESRKDLFTNPVIKDFLDMYPEKMSYLTTMKPEERYDYAAEAVAPHSIADLLWRNSIFGDYVSLCTSKDGCHIEKAMLSGPWLIEEGEPYQLMQSLARDINFDTLLKCVALDNLDSYHAKSIIINPNSKSNMYGIADLGGNIGFEGTKGAAAHEFSHKLHVILNERAQLYPDLNPYSTGMVPRFIGSSLQLRTEESEFERVMQATLANLDKQFNVYTENPYIGRRQYVTKVKGDNRDSVIIDVVSLAFNRPSYDKDEAHSEFSVRLAEIVGTFGELPPHIRKCFAPFEEYYKSYLIPKAVAFIENHPRKAMLLPTDQDRFHPETIFRRSGEDELLAKDSSKLTEAESGLVSKINEVQKLIAAGESIESVHNIVAATGDERLLRPALKACIKHDNLQVFSDLFALSKAPQYLGPLLPYAAELDRISMAKKLVEVTDNKYYLAKTLEEVVERNPEIVEMLVDKIDDSWFLQESVERFPDNDFIRQVYNMAKAIEHGKNIFDGKDNHEFIMELSTSSGAMKYIAGGRDDHHHLILYRLMLLGKNERKFALQLFEDKSAMTEIGQDPGKFFQRLDVMMGRDLSHVDRLERSQSNPGFGNQIG